MPDMRPGVRYRVGSGHPFFAGRRGVYEMTSKDGDPGDLHRGDIHVFSYLIDPIDPKIYFCVRYDDRVDYATLDAEWEQRMDDEDRAEALAAIDPTANIVETTYIPPCP